MRKYWKLLLLVSAWWLVQWQTAPQVCKPCCVLESPQASYRNADAVDPPWVGARPKLESVVGPSFTDPLGGGVFAGGLSPEASLPFGSRGNGFAGRP